MLAVEHSQRGALQTFLVHSKDIAKFYMWREHNYPKMFTNEQYPPNTLFVIDRLVQEQFLIEIRVIGVVYRQKLRLSFQSAVVPERFTSSE